MVIETSKNKAVSRGLVLALLASTASIAGTGIAFAQTAPSTAPATTTSAAQSGSDVETVIVTAEKRSERLIDVPTSISVVTAEDIQDKTMIQLSDIAIQVPNVQFQGSSLFPNIVIRGVGSASGTETGVDPAAVVYVDGVYQGRERAENIPLAGVQQIEVLRGPQGTLYGENTIGGAINITTVKPDGQERAEGDIMFGNLGYVQTSAFVTGALTDNLFTSITGTYRNRDGFIHNAFDNSNLDYDRDAAGRVRFVWDATSRLTVDFSADYLHENDSESLLTTSYVSPFSLIFPFPKLQPNSRTEYVNSPENGRREVYGGSVHAAYDFGGSKFDSITSYRGYTSSYAFDSDGTPISFDAENDLDNANLFTQEFRLTSTDSGPFQWITGAYYSHQRLVDSFDNIFYAPLATLFGLPGATPSYSDQVTSRGRIISNEYALFANASYEITDRWKIQAGFRYSIDQKNLVYSQLDTGLTGGPVGLGCIVLQCMPYANPHLEEHVPTGDISLTYKIDDNQSAYAKFSRGYKSGGFNAYLNTAGFNPATDFKFLPEYLNNYELGYKSSLWNGLLTLNGDVFYDDYSNKQEEVENIAAVSLVVKNAAQATIYGAELEADVHPLDGLTFSGTLGLLHTRYGLFDNAGSPAPCDCDTGNSLPGAPQLQATLAAQYEHYIPGWDGWAGMIRVEGLHQSHSFTDPENTVSLINKPLDLLNGRLGVENGTWGFYLWGNNLTGTYHLAGGLSELVAVARGVNLPTTYGGEITFKF
jgi:iron complex outermembrane recepter protein